MARYIITGGNKLLGQVAISGNKNAILPCMAAALLTDQEVTLHNVPQIVDVDTSTKLLQKLGASVERFEHTLKINCQKISDPKLPEELVTKLRASVLYVGPLLSRKGKVEFFHPGGDIIGKRSINTHITGFKEMGFKFTNSDRSYKGWGTKRKEALSIFLEEPSVTATENLIMAAVLGESEITFKNCASEPHVVDLCNMLISMGAKIEGVGSPTIKIIGVSKLSGTEFTIGADYVEFGTFAVAAAITGGKIEILKKHLGELDPVVSPLRKMGVDCIDKGSYYEVSAKKILAVEKIFDNIWPGFPTDLMSVIIVLATQAKGVTLCHDWMYESRMFFVDKLISMGANITIADPHRVLVSGPCKLYGRNMDTPDIRAGMALVLAALISKGDSIINRSELIERGYEDVAEKLSSLGAKIQREE